MLRYIKGVKGVFQKIKLKTDTHKTLSKMAAIIAVLVAAVVFYTFTVFAWFSDSVKANAKIEAGRYAAQLEIRNAEDTVIWHNEGAGVLSFDNIVDLNGYTGSATLVVKSYNFGEATLDFQYKIDFMKDSVPLLSEELVMGKGDFVEYPLNIESGQLSLRFLTAYKNSVIHTAASFEDLEKHFEKGSVVYLTQDIAGEDKTLTFSQLSGYPNINLGGYTLSLKGFEMDSEGAQATTVNIENGVLIVDGRTYRDGESLPVSGSGRVVQNLKDLRDSSAGRQKKVGITEIVSGLASAPEKSETEDEINEENSFQEEPSQQLEPQLEPPVSEATAPKPESTEPIKSGETNVTAATAKPSNRVKTTASTALPTTGAATSAHATTPITATEAAATSAPTADETPADGGVEDPDSLDEDPS